MVDVRALMRLAAEDPARAAAELEKAAAKLLEAAAALRSLAENPNRSVGGAGDRVQMRVVGPDGSVKQTADTGVCP